MQAFTGALAQETGEVYQPQYLSGAAYQSMITGSMGNRNQGGNGNRDGDNRKGKGGQNGQGSISTQSGMSIALDDSANLYVQLGNSRYNQSIGFAPQADQGVTIVMFPGDQGVYSAVTITLDSAGQTYSFRDANGRPLWTGSKGDGNRSNP